MAITFATYVHNFVYPRKEGEKLERLVETIDRRNVEMDAESRKSFNDALAQLAKNTAEQDQILASRLNRMEDEYRSDIRHIRDKLDELMRVFSSRMDGARRTK